MRKEEFLRTIYYCAVIFSGLSNCLRYKINEFTRVYGHKYNSEEISKASEKFGQAVVSLEKVIYILKK